MIAAKLKTKTEVVVPQASEAFVNTPRVQDLAKRAMAYLKVGYPVNFSGPAGTGKTTLAFHVAAQLGRPVMLIHGDDEFKGSDLVGRDVGYRRSKVVDNFIHSVVKTEEEMKSLWADNCLTTACREGATLIYDEFTRSRPEANNALLAILEEKILSLPALQRTGGAYQKVHPDFRVIFTSNPDEYVGTHKTQDALIDRMITMSIGHHDRDTEVQITMKKAALPRSDAEVIVDLVRELRAHSPGGHWPTIRASIALGRLASYLELSVEGSSEELRVVAHDVLNRDSNKLPDLEGRELHHIVDECWERIFAGRPARVMHEDFVIKMT
jgi:gas vesicle protein GvpN